MSRRGEELAHQRMMDLDVQLDRKGNRQGTLGGKSAERFIEVSSPWSRMQRLGRERRAPEAPQYNLQDLARH